MVKLETYDVEEPYDKKKGGKAIETYDVEEEKKPSKAVGFLKSVKEKGSSGIKKLASYASEKYKEATDPVLQEERISKQIKLEEKRHILVSKRQKLVKLKQSNRQNSGSFFSGITTENNRKRPTQSNPFENLGSLHGTTQPLGEFTSNKSRGRTFGNPMEEFTSNKSRGRTFGNPMSEFIRRNKKR